MDKKLLILSLFAYILSAFSCSNHVPSATEQSDRERLGINGNVLEMIETKIDSANQYQIVSVFDSVGDLKSQTLYIDSLISRQTIYSDTARWQINADGEIEWYVELHLNENGLVESEYSESDLGAWQTYYSYDEQGRLSMQTNINSKGELSSVEQYAYNKQGLLYQQIIVDGNGQIASQTNYTYNRRCQLVTSEQFDGDGLLQMKQTNEYDNDGNELSQLIVDANNQVLYESKSVYDHSHLVEKICSGNNVYDQHFQYIYKDNQLYRIIIVESETINGVKHILIQTDRTYGANENLIDEVVCESDDYGMLRMVSHSVFSYNYSTQIGH